MRKKGNREFGGKEREGILGAVWGERGEKASASSGKGGLCKRGEPERGTPRFLSDPRRKADRKQDMAKGKCHRRLIDRLALRPFGQR